MRTMKFSWVFLGTFICSLMLFGISGSAFATETVYEDAEDGDILGWSVYDNTPSGATISNIYDTDRGSRVIELSGSGTSNGYDLRDEDGSDWQNSTEFNMEWRMKCSGEIRVFVDVETDAGHRYIYYTPVDYDGLANATGEYIHHGIGSDITDGEWHSFLRDLESDLKDAQPSNNITEVNGIRIRGSGRLDDIKLLSSVPLLSINDVGVDEDAGSAVFTISTSVTSGNTITVDYDTGDDTAEAGYDYVTSTGTATIGAGSASVNISVTVIDDSDIEGSEAFSVTLSNASNATITDDTGIATITDNDMPPGYTIYEDAQDGDTLGWSVYDNDPFGGTVSNIYDTDRGSRVIELSGSGTLNGYDLRNEEGSDWQNDTQHIIEWSMKCTEEVRVFVDVETDSGHRFIYYTPVDSDSLGTGEYVHHGLGSGITDGEWRTFVRDLEADLKDAQPGNSIIEINGLRIRGSGSFDDIKLLVPLLSIDDISIAEDGGLAVFTVTASITRESEVTVDYVTSDGTAEAGYDYVTSSGTATISAGTSSVDVSVTIIDDTDLEGSETFSMTLSDPTNSIIMDGTGEATIIDNETPPYTVYEDAEDGDTLGWSVYDNNPLGGTITNIYDTDRSSRVIELSGSGTLNGYEIRSEDGSDWQNSTQFVIEWSMKCTEEVRVFVDVETDAGHRYIQYTPVDSDNLGTGEYVHHGLGSDITDGEWRTFVRDLEADLQDAQPSVNITEVNGIRIRGSARLDDIILHPELPPLLSIGDITVAEDAGTAVFTVTASETTSRVITVDYTTGDGMAEAGSDYVTSSGTATIASGSASVNISVTITDDTEFEVDEDFSVILSHPTNAVISDGIGQGSIPANDFPAGRTVYEDAEDGDTLGWSVYDNSPSGATITNIYDSDRATRVIELLGSGTSNGYDLRNEDGSDWQNTTQTGFFWAMKCSGEVRVFVDVETDDGHRYIWYSTIDSDNLENASGEYIHHGLGSGVMDGEWHTFMRDLEADLQEAQPSNNITEVNGLRIRGSGSFDYIFLY